MATSVSIGLGWLLVIESGDRGEDGDLIGDSGDYDREHNNQPGDGGQGGMMISYFKLHGGHDGDKRFSWFGMVAGYRLG